MQRRTTNTAHGKHARRTSPTGRGRAFTLLESLIAVALAALLLAIYSAMLTGTFVLRRSSYNIQAADFIQEELDALRTVPFTNLTNRTNGGFLGVALQRGTWAVADDSGNHVLRLSKAAPDLNGETGLALLPGNYRADFTVSADVRASASSPSGWSTGIAFRYLDNENHYRFRMSSGGYALDLVDQGTVTTLWDQSVAIGTNEWHTLQVTASGDQFTLDVDGVTLATVTDTTFTEGDIGLMSSGSALADFDNVSIDSPTAETWDFTSTAVGDFPSDWLRLSYDSLPSGEGTLTIEDYLGQSTIKKATVTISWLDAGVRRSNSGTAIIAQ